MNQYQKVFSPLKFGNVTVKNRIECGPAVPILATPDGYVTRELIEWSKALARGGAGIVTIGDSAIDFEYARDHEGQLNIGTDHVIPGLSTLVEVIHRYGAKASIELTHGGRNVRPQLINGKNPIGPSAIPSKQPVGMFTGKRIDVQEMDQSLIDQVIENYSNACYRCMVAGFEMVTLHGAHGHLLAQFVSPYTNKRNDSYGGNLESRAKFPLEVLSAIRRKVGNKLALEYRISGDELIPEGMHLEDTIEFIKMIEDKVDLIHVSAGIIGDSRTDIQLGGRTNYLPPMYNVERAEKIKKAVKVPVAVVGAIKDLDMAEKILEEGKADICVMVTSIVADPEIVNKTQRGEVEDIRPCIRCMACTNKTAKFLPCRCTVNPVTGREAEFGSLKPAEKKKKVLIIGGGPAGMEAAQIASSRGHNVTLYEKDSRLGGTLHIASELPFKADMKKYMYWLIRETDKYPVQVKLSTEVTPEIVKAERPDVVIIAVGAIPFIPNIPGAKKPLVVSVNDVDAGKVPVGNKVVVAGAGLTGCESALNQAQHGKQVTLVDMLSEAEIASELPFLNRSVLMYLLRSSGVKIVSEVKIEEITDKGIWVISKQWQRQEILADTVVFALGVKPRLNIVEQLSGLARETYIIGDCIKPRNLMGAIHDAFNVAAEI